MYLYINTYPIRAAKNIKEKLLNPNEQPLDFLLLQGREKKHEGRVREIELERDLNIR